MSQLKDYPVSIGLVTHFDGLNDSSYRQGALMINNKAKLYVDYIGDFDDINKAQDIADKQYNKGVKVIFHASENAGKGVIKEAQSRSDNGEEVFVVGVDRDQYKDGFYGKQKNLSY